MDILQGNRSRDAGEVSVLGGDPATGTRAWRSPVGIVRQDESTPAGLTLRETVRHFARCYPCPATPTGFSTWSAWPRRPTAVSRRSPASRRRRLDVALGVIGDAELPLLDAPTTGFDPAARRRSWNPIRLLADEGTTILLTTHCPEEAETLADRLAVVTEGRVVAVGHPRRAAPTVRRWGSGRRPDGTRRLPAHGAHRPAERTVAALDRPASSAVPARNRPSPVPCGTACWSSAKGAGRLRRPSHATSTSRGGTAVPPGSRPPRSRSVRRIPCP